MNSANDLAVQLDALQRKVNALARRHRLLQVLVIALIGALSITAAAAFPGARQTAVDENGVLTVRGVIVVDERGTPRVQLGAPLPDPPVLGKRISRGGTANGILLFDREGNERGGYVTFDESGLVMLSLDEVAHMAAQFAAGPAGGARLWIRNRHSENLRLGVNENGVYADGLPKEPAGGETGK